MSNDPVTILTDDHSITIEGPKFFAYTPDLDWTGHDESDGIYEAFLEGRLFIVNGDVAYRVIPTKEDD